MRRLSWLAAAVVVAAMLGSIGGCSTLDYLYGAASGHLALLRAARPVSDWLAVGDASGAPLPAPLRERLVLSQRLRDFAVAELGLPDNASYRRYADLHRRAAVWNVVAAPELSLELRRSCFPVVGCVGYRGYFDRAAADAQAAAWRADGDEATVYGVPAYSTLGRLPGDFFADPLLNTFIDWPEIELARMMFHELAHQVAYAESDTIFNESYASAVGRLGGERWAALHAGAAARAETAALDARRRDFRELTARTRQALEAIYRGPGSDDARRTAKAEAMRRLRSGHAALKAGPWRGWRGYDEWFERANNASLAVLGAYDDLVPAFECLFDSVGGDFGRFHAEVRRIAALPAAGRRAALAPYEALRPAGCLHRQAREPA